MAQAQIASSERIAVLDPSGNVETWLQTGRGVAVWQNVDLSSHDVGAYAFTPGDTEGAPSWRYRLLARAGAGGARDPEGNAIEDWQGFAFYRRGDVLAHWTDTPSGWRAAHAACARIERYSVDVEGPAAQAQAQAPTHWERMTLAGRSVLVDLRRQWTAPAGTFARALTVERIEYQTSARVPYPLAPELAPAVEYARPADRPLDTMYRAGIVVWYAQLA